MTSPAIEIALASKTKNQEFGQAATIILKSMSIGRVLSSSDMHGNGLRLGVM